jgi:hypothetical protein
MVKVCLIKKGINNTPEQDHKESRGGWWMVDSSRMKKNWGDGDGLFNGR